MPKSTQQHILCFGCGAMGQAILQGLAKANTGNFVLHAYNRSKTCYKNLEQQNIICHQDMAEAVKAADLIILGVKPYSILTVLTDILPYLQKQTVVASIAANVSMQSMVQVAQNTCPIVRIMPNTPTLIGEGTFAVCYEDPALNADQTDFVTYIFEQIGHVILLPETRFAAFTAIMGCGPAYVFYFMEAVAEAAVHLGFTRSEANDLSKRLFSSSSKLAISQTHSPTNLRESVCSPAGITIQAIQHLDRHAIKGYTVDAILAAYNACHE